MDQVITELIKLSILGPILVALGLYTLRIHKDLRASEDGRIKDAQAVVDKLLKLNSDWNTTINSLLNAAEAQKEANENQRERAREAREILNEFRELVAELKGRAK